MTALAPQSGKRPFILRKGISSAADLDTKPVVITASTVTLNPVTHAGRPIVFDLAAGIVATLPAAAGTGDKYSIFVKTTFTGAASVVVANATDVMTGTALLLVDGGDTVVGFATAASSDTVDLFETGNTTGGMLGAQLELVDLASGLWGVRYISDAAGSEATPFAATVS
jgi:hypothetical protein